MSKAWTAIFNPSFLCMTLNGLSSLSTLTTLKNDKSESVKRLKTETITIKKSTILIELLRYDSFPLKTKPVAITFIINSIRNMIVIHIFIISKFWLNLELGSFKGFSSASVIDDITMISRMK